MDETAVTVRQPRGLRRLLRRRAVPLAEVVDVNATSGVVNVLIGAYPFLADPAVTQHPWIPAGNLVLGALLLIRCYWLVLRRKGRADG